MDEVKFDVTVNSSDFIEKMEQIRAAMQVAATEADKYSKDVGLSAKESGVCESVISGITHSSTQITRSPIFNMPQTPKSRAPQNDINKQVLKAILGI